MVPTPDWSVPLAHNLLWEIRPNPWGSGVVLVSHFGACKEGALICCGHATNTPDEEDVRAVLEEGWGEKYAAVAERAMGLHSSLLGLHLFDAAGAMMTGVQTAIAEAIAERAEQRFSDRILGPVRHD
jgi:hypothetical protein